MCHWYGFDVSTLPEHKQRGLLLNVKRLEAQERLRTGNYDSLDIDGCYHLTMAATGDEDLAQRAALDAAWRLSDQEAEAEKWQQRPTGG